MGTTQSAQADRCSQADAKSTATEGLRGLKKCSENPPRLVGSLVSEASTPLVVETDFSNRDLEPIEDTEEFEKEEEEPIMEVSEEEESSDEEEEGTLKETIRMIRELLHCTCFGLLILIFHVFCRRSR